MTRTLLVTRPSDANNNNGLALQAFDSKTPSHKTFKCSIRSPVNRIEEDQLSPPATGLSCEMIPFLKCIPKALWLCELPPSGHTLMKAWKQHHRNIDIVVSGCSRSFCFYRRRTPNRSIFLSIGRTERNVRVTCSEAHNCEGSLTNPCAPVAASLASSGRMKFRLYRPPNRG